MDVFHCLSDGIKQHNFYFEMAKYIQWLFQTSSQFYETEIDTKTAMGTFRL